jgi:ADP-ribosylglycohydrolase
MIGAALGDAMGKLTEFIDHDTILYQFGPQGITEPPQLALFTDDTQMAMATARALIRAGDEPMTELMAQLTSRYLAWLDLQERAASRRAPGVTVMDALGRLRRGAPYAVSGDGGANESIAATRSLPVALRYHGDVGRVAVTAAEIARITHAHPGATSGAAAAALLVELGLSGLPPAEWPDRAISLVKRWCPDNTHLTVEALRTAQRTLDWPAQDAMEEQFRARPGFGGGWTADEAVGLALWCVLQAPEDYLTVVRLAANAYAESDTDGIATIAGALCGAHNGIQAIPAEWVERLEEGPEIRGLAEELCAIRSRELGLEPD